jgi:hypothetical protein
MVMRIFLMIHVMYRALDVSPSDASINCLLSALKIHVVVEHNYTVLERIGFGFLVDWCPELYE